MNEWKDKRNGKEEKDNGDYIASFTYKNGFIFKLSHSKIRKVKNLYDSNGSLFLRHIHSLSSYEKFGIHLYSYSLFIYRW